MLSVPCQKIKKQALCERYELEYEEGWYEEVRCPHCGGRKFVRYGYRNRQGINANGSRYIFRIPRVRCKGCGKIHHVLPTFLVPLRRYFLDVIERFGRKRKPEPEAPYEEKSRYRLKKFAEKFIQEIETSYGGALKLARERQKDVSLREKVKALVNMGYFSSTRTDILTG